ncbi:hypothetical protein [Vulcanisaeta souniana]|uniref:shikimate dehydrogenase family protein n=1 Tax=Vulcanisaeta souniana TaxID=164452 RepID=UPI000AF266F5|nr:hypothetical protein [Vulcanisaeta souniana]
MQVYAVIGYPLNHTLSPNIHNYVFKVLGVDSIYVPLRIPPKKLHYFVEVAKDSLGGFNVTMPPHKVSIVNLINDVVGPAKVLNSVNTVMNKDGELLGYNTDYIAIRHALSEGGVTQGGRMP